MKFLLLLIWVFLILMGTPGRAEEDDLIRPHLRHLHRAGKFQYEIANDLGVGSSLVSKYLAGKVNTSPTIIRGFRRRYPDIFFALKAGKAQAEELAHLPSQLSFRPSRTKGRAPFMFLFLHDQAARTEKLKTLSGTLTLKPSRVRTYTSTHPVPQGSKAPIAIGHRIEGNGKAAFYDHQTVQAATGVKTVSVYAPHHDQTHLAAYARPLPFHMPLLSKREMPPSLDVKPQDNVTLFKALPDTGLLVITGRASKYEGHTDQNNFEAALIRQAMVRGQPILAICAGCWPLWQYVPQQGQGEPKMPKGALKTVKDHVAGKMIYMSETHGGAVHNAQIHGLNIPEGTLLRDLVKTDTLRVNSVHSTAPDDSFIPDFFNISAWSVQDVGLGTRKNRHGDVMHPEEDTVEAFESKFGAPVLGIQWHPEAYNKNKNTAGVVDAEKHRGIIKHMANAGQAYAQKRHMLEELHTVFQALQE